jgi:hypothetical protein
MRPVLILLVLLIAAACAAFVHREKSAAAAREAASNVVVSKPASRSVSLEERAAAAQGTTLPPEARRPSPQPFAAEPVERAESAAPAGRYQCDGRIYCSQMHSCEEATWFLQHCPGTRMDGENDGQGDGVPCERQWCGRR